MSKIEQETVTHEGVPDEARPGHRVSFPYDVDFVNGHPFAVRPGQRIFRAHTFYMVEAWETLEREDRGTRRTDDAGPYRAFGYTRVGEEPGKPQFIVRP